MNARGTFGRPLFLLSACLAAQLIAALAIVPPWQNPDEPQHLIAARLVRERGADFDVASTWGNASERAIVASMRQHAWWEHYGRPAPAEPPGTFADGPAAVIGDYFGPPSGGSRLYYRAVAGVFGAASLDDLLPQLYAMRLLSALAALFTVWCVWSGTRAWLDERAATVVTALLVLHPQFVLVSSTASPDAFVNLAGAVVWRQSALLVASGLSVRGIAVLWLAAVAAVVIRRMGAPLLIVAAVVSVGVGIRDLARPRGWRIALPSAAAAAGLLLLAAPTLGSDWTRAISWAQFDPVRSLAAISGNANGLPVFFDMLWRTFWLSAGWARYAGPSWWYVVLAAVALIATVGLVRRFGRGPVDPSIWVGGLAVAIQVGIVLAYYFGIRQAGAQGRYLFPVLPAMLYLLWLGWSSLAPQDRQRPAAVSLVAVMALLNVSAWAAVVLPAYA